MGPDVDPAGHHAEDQDPGDEPPAAGQVGRDDAGERGDEHGVARDEALPDEVDVAPPLARPVPIDVPGRSRLTSALTARSLSSLRTVTSDRRDRQPVPPQDERDDRHERADDQRTELLERPHQGVQRVG